MIERLKEIIEKPQIMYTIQDELILASAIILGLMVVCAICCGIWFIVAKYRDKKSKSCKNYNCSIRHCWEHNCIGCPEYKKIKKISKSDKN